MKFLFFNAAVIAALGFILIDKNFLDRRIVDDLRENAAALIDRADGGNADAPRQTEERSSEAAPEQDQTAAALPADAQMQSSAARAEGRESDKVIEPPPKASVPVAVEEIVPGPNAVLEDVPAAVAERRAEVLAPPGVGAPGPRQTKATGPDRRERLRALADELEAMSVDMIYQ